MSKKLLQKMLNKLEGTNERTNQAVRTFEDEVKNLRNKLQEEITVATLEEVNSKINKFRKSLNLDPIISSVENIKTNFNESVALILSKIEEKYKEKEMMDGDKEARHEEIKNITSKLSAEVVDKGKKIEILNKELDSVKTNITKVQESNLKTIKTEIKTIEEGLKKEIKGISKFDPTDLKNDFTNRLEEINNRVSTVASRGGGSPNQKVSVNGTWATQRYADIDFVMAGAIVTNDDTNKLTTIDLDGSGTTGFLKLDQSIPQTITGVGLKLTAGMDIRPSVDSTTAINIAQADGTDFVTFDTTNKRVGIGTTAPFAKLTVGSVTGVYTTGLNTTSLIFGVNDKAKGQLGIYSTDAQAVDKGGTIVFGGENNVAGSYSPYNFGTIGAYKEGATNTFNGYLALSTTQTNSATIERMRIDSAGNVGIGTISPTATLHLEKTSDNHLKITQPGGTGIGWDIWHQYSTGAVYLDSLYDNSSSANNMYFRTRTGGTPINAMTILANGNVGIGTTTPGEKLEVTGNIQLTTDGDLIKLGTGEDMTIQYTGTVGRIDTSLVAASDLQIDCGTDKTLVLDESVWEDIQFPIEAGKVPAANYPTYEAFTSANIEAFAFSVDDKIQLSSNEPPHGWSEGTLGYAHVHFALKTQNVTTVKYAKFELIFAYADYNGIWTEQAAITQEQTIPIDAAALQNYILSFTSTVTLTGLHIGSQIKCRVKRIAATGGTEYADDVYITQVGIHVEKVRIGSRTLSAA